MNMIKKEEIVRRIESLLEEGIKEECMIGSLIRINEGNYDTCGSNHVGGCYYCIYNFPGEEILSDVRVCNPLIKLGEIK